MRHYLATLHKRPDHHKRRFALLASGSITVLIFVAWALVTFGNGGTLAENNNDPERANPEIGPIDSLRAGASESLDALGNSFKDLKSGVFNTYGE